jgi:hypothetical protein
MRRLPEIEVERLSRVALGCRHVLEWERREIRVARVVENGLHEPVKDIVTSIEIHFAAHS